MKILALSGRNTKEMLRDPLTVAFSLGFPLMVLLLLSAIQANIPVNLFEISHLAPGIAAFGLSFMTLFSATLIARDRETALLQRLYSAPLKASDFILGYVLPLIPVSAAQSTICYLAALALGLPMTATILLAVAFIIPVSLLYIAMGLLFGSVLNVKQVGGICGALLTNVAAWLSGTWFDLNLVGGTFRRVACALPFVHVVELERAALRGEYSAILPHLVWVMGYTAVLMILAVLLFLRQMKKQ